MAQKSLKKQILDPKNTIFSQLLAKILLRLSMFFADLSNKGLVGKMNFENFIGVKWQFLQRWHPIFSPQISHSAAKEVISTVILLWKFKIFHLHKNWFFSFLRRKMPLFWAAAPKGSMTYDSTQGNFLRVSGSPGLRVSESPGLRVSDCLTLYVWLFCGLFIFRRELLLFLGQHRGSAYRLPFSSELKTFAIRARRTVTYLAACWRFLIRVNLNSFNHRNVAFALSLLRLRFCSALPTSCFYRRFYWRMSKSTWFYM